MTDSEIVRVVARLRMLETKKRSITTEIDGIRARLREEFDERGQREIQAGRYLVRQVEFTRETFDTKKFREQQPKAYELYCKAATVRRIDVVG